MAQLIMNNVVKKDTMRSIQSKTLKELAEYVKLSFGPNGSNTCIKKENALCRYTKDGHTIIGAINYNGIIEQSIKDDVESITRHIVKTVGDGTSSAVILSSIIFDKIVELENEGYMPIQINRELEHVVRMICDEIDKSKQELDPKKVYDIAMISTNGNEDIATHLTGIYHAYGNEVFIDVTPSTSENFYVKSYDGMTLNTGYADPCYVTNPKNNTSNIDHPCLYFFEHPVDTKELGVYLDSIISNNILTPVNKGATTGDYSGLVPTVIFAPMISQDVSSLMDQLETAMASMPANNRLPICVITGYHEVDQLNDLAKMCGAKMIHKYIDPKIYEEDVKAGRAPTAENVYTKFAGRCESVIAYNDKTTFIRPAAMYNDDGSYSNAYKSLLSYLESEIKKESENGGDIKNLGTLKRRLHSLKANLVELFVGGITQADRDSLRDLVEDAVLNIRSAANNGVGYGGNMSAACAIYNMVESEERTTTRGMTEERYLEYKITKILYDAYSELVTTLFKDAPYYNSKKDDKEHKHPDVTFDDLVKRCIEKGEVYNIAKGMYMKNVLSSIKSDITILETVSKIIGIMATCNQFILPTAMHNIYTDPTK